MTKIALSVVSGLYLLYLAVATALYGLMTPFIVVGYRLICKGRIDDALRFFNRLYGHYLVRSSWPLLKIAASGRENMPRDTACVVVVNHRSTADIFFAPFFTPSNTVVFVRSWPFKLWVLSWFMKRAGYVDIEKTDIRAFVAGRGKELRDRAASFLFFPEGHRSRDGRLQAFRSGAFLLAAELNIPIVPVCMSGTEKFLPMKDHLVRPATVTMEILPPVHPASFPEERRAVKLKKHVEAVIRGHLDQSSNAECLALPGQAACAMPNKSSL